ncbi:MAG: dienelactone hydrolase family protein [Pseudomonadota bacterium]|nr:dienelactone hydrolase family protein [Pseudomonadota bacterium]|tara:strand:+ start:3300 stop:3968 length:669 start_codon:yes stop_codon:yes gene_type:complete
MSFRQENVVIIEPQETHRASIIWLHGLGADGHDFESIVPELNLSNKLGIRFIFPNAPIRQITINNNMKMRGWYDIKSTNLREIEDVGSIIESSNLIHGYIDTEVKKGIKSNKIIVAGFSQGGAIALHSGTRYTSRLAGILALSAYLPIPENLKKEASKHKETPIVMAHGRDDNIIPVEQGRSSCQTLIENGYKIEWNEYIMQHTICPEEILMIRNWIKNQLS